MPARPERPARLRGEPGGPGAGGEVVTDAADRAVHRGQERPAVRSDAGRDPPIGQETGRSNGSAASSRTRPTAFPASGKGPWRAPVVRQRQLGLVPPIVDRGVRGSRHPSAHAPAAPRGRPFATVGAPAPGRTAGSRAGGTTAAGFASAPPRVRLEAVSRSPAIARRGLGGSLDHLERLPGASRRAGRRPARPAGPRWRGRRRGRVRPGLDPGAGGGRGAWQRRASVPYPAGALP